MSTQELLAAINSLSPEERLTLLEVLARSLREELSSREGKQPVPVAQVRGLLKTGDAPPTTSEINDNYVRYLTEKYS